MSSVTNEAGAVIAEQNFDAWGRYRNPANWTYTSIPARPEWLYRGFTGHEHLVQFALINMNGRMYDPVTGMMMSPDNYNAKPWSPVGYNRYMYANGNPLKFTDPSGWLVKEEFEAIIQQLLKYENGGYWNANEGSVRFNSAGQAFGYGLTQMSQNNWWGVEVRVHLNHHTKL